MSCKDLDSSKKFKSALNDALAGSGGVFWEDIKDTQLQLLLKDMTKKYFLDGGRVRKAVTNVGRQPVLETKDHMPEKDIYVFNETDQVFQ